MYGDVQLSVAETFTYLGVTISSDICSREHAHNRPMVKCGCADIWMRGCSNV